MLVITDIMSCIAELFVLFTPHNKIYILQAITLFFSCCICGRVICHLHPEGRVILQRKCPVAGPSCPSSYYLLSPHQV